MNESDGGGLVLLDAGSKGKGVFATRRFLPGDLLLTFRGPVLARSEFEDFTHVIQVGVDRFLGASGGIDDYVNHSCDPNAALALVGGRLQLRARRPVAEGEEITFDYSTCMVEEPALAPCSCGSDACRGEVVPFRELPRVVRAAYRARREVPRFADTRRPVVQASRRPV